MADFPANDPFLKATSPLTITPFRFTFASADKLWELTGVEVGATTILSAVLPEAANVHLVMDAGISKADYFACTDGTPTCFVKIRTQDLIDKYLEGRELTLI